MHSGQVENPESTPLKMGRRSHPQSWRARMNLKNVGPFLRFRLTKVKYLRRRLGSTITSNCDLDHMDEGTLVITVVAFNNVELLRYQRELLALTSRTRTSSWCSTIPASRDSRTRSCDSARKLDSLTSDARRTRSAPRAGPTPWSWSGSSSTSWSPRRCATSGSSTMTCSPCARRLSSPF
jgi:hypothetical protein